MSNIIDSIQISGVTYTIQGSGGGGKAIEAGRGITVTTGTTADTVSFNLPISAGTGTNSIQEGDGTEASGDYSHAEGSYTTASGDSAHAEGYQTLAGGNYSHAEGGDSTASGNRSHAEGNNTTAGGLASHAEGIGTEANNRGEHASGYYNASHSGSTEADKTLFSVGNGTYDDDRHNAFEIRQNGDIYISSGGTDIKLQDNLGGGGGGNPTVELTQAQYDALVTAGTVSADTYYIITDAQAGDLTQYWTSAQTNSAITQAVSGKQDTLVSGTNIKTVNNTSILGSGNISIEGKGVVAGRGITVTTGATADTVSFNLPISGGTGSRSIIEGLATVANGTHSHAEGTNTTARGINSHTEGQGTETKNEAEHASGKYNVSSSASPTFGDSGNTLFSVGNGTPSAKHNAFEIRQNGDIYLNNGTSDVKLQDYIQIKVIKLTQSEYEALSPNYDSNTLYVING